MSRNWDQLEAAVPLTGEESFPLNQGAGGGRHTRRGVMAQVLEYVRRELKVSPAEQADAGERAIVRGFGIRTETGYRPDDRTQEQINELLVEGWPEWAIWWEFLGDSTGAFEILAGDSLLVPVFAAGADLIGTLPEDSMIQPVYAASGSLIGVLPVDALQTLTLEGEATLVGVAPADSVALTPIIGTGSADELGGVEALGMTMAVVAGAADLAGTTAADAVVLAVVTGIAELAGVAAGAAVACSISEAGAELIGIVAGDSVLGTTTVTAGDLAGAVTGDGVSLTVTLEPADLALASNDGVGADPVVVLATVGDATATGALDAASLTVYTNPFGVGDLIGALPVSDLSAAPASGTADLAGLLNGSSISAAVTVGIAEASMVVDAAAVGVALTIGTADLTVPASADAMSSAITVGSGPLVGVGAAGAMTVAINLGSGDATGGATGPNFLLREEFNTAVAPAGWTGTNCLYDNASPLDNKAAFASSVTGSGNMRIPTFTIPSAAYLVFGVRPNTLTAGSICVGYDGGITNVAFILASTAAGAITISKGSGSIGTSANGVLTNGGVRFVKVRVVNGQPPQFWHSPSGLTGTWTGPIAAGNNSDYGLGSINFLSPGSVNTTCFGHIWVADADFSLSWVPSSKNIDFEDRILWGFIPSASDFTISLTSPAYAGNWAILTSGADSFPGVAYSNAVSAGTLSFYAKRGGASGTMSLQVRNGASVITTLTLTTAYQLFSVTVPAMAAGQLIMEAQDWFNLYIDNVTFP